MATAVLEFWDRRLENWALWLCSGSSRASVGVSHIYRGRRTYDERPALPVPLVGEANDTDRLIGRLSNDHQSAVRAMYLWTGTMQERARAVGCCTTTLSNRVRAAKFRLDDMYHATRAVQKRARAAQSRMDIAP